MSFTACWTFAFMHAVGENERLGVIIGISALVAGLVSFGAGRRFDKRHRVSLLYTTTILRSLAMLSYLLIAVYPTALLVLVIDVTYRIIDAAHGTVRGAYIFGLSNKLSPVAFQFNREFALNSVTSVYLCVLCGEIFIKEFTTEDTEVHRGVLRMEVFQRSFSPAREGISWS
ncbi:hypothetical protein [Methanothrix soehngenii]|uniref:hypothetical protein n=1 Tax=Methanothrix soehngenii TaxID=2223 RepID=UPI00300CFEC6